MKPKVKSLEWKPYPEDGGTAWEGQGERRQYLLRVFPPIGPAIFIMRKDDVYSVDGLDLNAEYGSEAEAKAAVQSYYEARIYSALVLEQGETETPCPVCGNEERGQGGYLSCECPAPSPPARDERTTGEAGAMAPDAHCEWEAKWIQQNTYNDHLITENNKLRRALSTGLSFRTRAERSAVGGDAKRHATALRQCSIFARDAGDHIAQSMLDAAEFLSSLTESLVLETGEAEPVASQIVLMSARGDIAPITSKDALAIAEAISVQPAPDERLETAIAKFIEQYDFGIKTLAASEFRRALSAVKELGE